MRLRRSIVLAAGGGALLSACPAMAVPHTYIVVIDKMKFGPTPSQLRTGDAIVWINRDFLRHGATAADHGFNVDLPPRTKARTVLAKRGTIPFVCRYHPGMRGTLVVK